MGHDSVERCVGAVGSDSVWVGRFPRGVGGSNAWFSLNGTKQEARGSRDPCPDMTAYGAIWCQAVFLYFVFVSSMVPAVFLCVRMVPPVSIS